MEMAVLSPPPLTVPTERSQELVIWLVMIFLLISLNKERSQLRLQSVRSRPQDRQPLTLLELGVRVQLDSLRLVQMDTLVLLVTKSRTLLLSLRPNTIMEAIHQTGILTLVSSSGIPISSPHSAQFKLKSISLELLQEASISRTPSGRRPLNQQEVDSKLTRKGSDYHAQVDSMDLGMNNIALGADTSIVVVLTML